jgi:LDH2 family malate/lactate/ureidoglycolate dehydrogenase
MGRFRLQLSSTQTTLAAGVGLGMAVGLALPPLWRRLRRHNNTTSNTTHAVRSFDGCIHLAKQTLEDLVAAILTEAGVSSKRNAALVASVLVYADARGIPSHGVNRADTYVNELLAGVVDGTATPTIETTTTGSCCATVHGHNGLGAVAADLAMTSAIRLAKEHGVGMVVCHASNHFGAAGYWAQMALEKGMIGMSFTNTSPFSVPTGGRTRAVGTNPFCFFAPTSAPHDGGFQLDMATTVVPVGKIEVMHRLGRAVPSGWGVDRYGNECTDGEEICRHGGLYPLGGTEETAGYKGYGLGMVVEILCGVLSGCQNVGPNIQPWLATRAGAIDYGHCFLAIDPNRFAPGFEDRLQAYLETMRSLPGHVQVAGDPEKRFEKDAKTKGVMLHAPVAATLKRLAEQFKVEIPEELKSLDSTNSKESLYAK